MLRATDVIAAVATSLNLPVAEVAQHARYLRERDLFIRETKSPRSWQVGVRDAAMLFAAVLTGAPAVRVVEAIQEMKDYSKAHANNIEICRGLEFCGEHYIEKFIGTDNFLSAIMVVVDLCMGAQSRLLDKLAGSYVEYDPTRDVGKIVFDVDPTLILTFSPGDLQGDTGALRRPSQIDFSAFRQVGRVLVRV